MAESTYQGVKFTDADMVNKDDYIPAGEYNPHNVHPWLLHDHGTAVCVVFADCLQDALDEAADAGKLDYLQIHPEEEGDREDYMVQDVVTPGYDPKVPDYVHTDGTEWWWKNEPTCLGNASEPFDIESLEVIELPNPAFSFCAMFNAASSDTAPRGWKEVQS